MEQRDRELEILSILVNLETRCIPFLSSNYLEVTNYLEAIVPMISNHYMLNHNIVTLYNNIRTNYPSDDHYIYEYYCFHDDINETRLAILTHMYNFAYKGKMHVSITTKFTYFRPINDDMGFMFYKNKEDMISVYKYHIDPRISKRMINCFYHYPEMQQMNEVSSMLYASHFNGWFYEYHGVPENYISFRRKFYKYLLDHRETLKRELSKK